MRKSKTSAGKISVFLIFTLFSVSILLPLLWMILSSLKTDVEFYESPWALPADPKWGNYMQAVRYGVGKYFLNSIMITAATIILTVLVSSFAAYILSRYSFRGKGLVILLVIGGMAISPEVNLVALYKIMRNLHLYDSRPGLVFLYSAFRLSFSILLIRSYMLGLPRAVEEAAYIDGCSAFGVFWHIVLPMSRPILASAALLTGMDAWNEYMFAVTFIEADGRKTIPVGLVSLESTLRTNQPVLISALVISSSVLIILFLLFQKQFIQGLTTGSVKE